MSAPKPPTVSVLLDPDWASGSLVDDVRRGLDRHPRTLPPKWLYDDAGSELFDEITRLEEYYPFTREHEILSAHAGEIADAFDQIIVLGARSRDANGVAFLESVIADEMGRHLPGDYDERN